MKGVSHPTNDVTLNPSSNHSIRDVIEPSRRGSSPVHQGRRRRSRTGVHRWPHAGRTGQHRAGRTDHRRVQASRASASSSVRRAAGPPVADMVSVPAGLHRPGVRGLGRPDHAGWRTVQRHAPARPPPTSSSSSACTTTACTSSRSPTRRRRAAQRPRRAVREQRVHARGSAVRRRPGGRRLHHRQDTQVAGSARRFHRRGPPQTAASGRWPGTRRSAAASPRTRSCACRARPPATRCCRPRSSRSPTRPARRPAAPPTDGWPTAPSTTAPTASRPGAPT